MLRKCLLGSLLVVNFTVAFATDDVPTKASKKASKPSAITDPYLSLADDIQRFAKRFTGTQYVWGGKAPKGFDCSGLVSYVYAQFGMNIKLTSAELYKLGYEMPVGAAIPGDLVFFRRTKDPKSPISHVGIVLEYNECGLKFIHAARNQGVITSYLPEKYYAEHFAGMRRVMDVLKNYKY